MDGLAVDVEFLSDLLDREPRLVVGHYDVHLLASQLSATAFPVWSWLRLAV